MSAVQLMTKATMITAFVAVMMIVVDYVNVLSEGTWQRALRGSRWIQYVAAVALGATPGCLGAFVVVALYLHRAISLGAVVACMIATSGDEAFVMFVMFPEKALVLTAILVVVGLLAGVLTDAVAPGDAGEAVCRPLPLHTGEPSCRCFDPRIIGRQLARPSWIRVVLVGSSLAFLLALATGRLAGGEETWIRVTLLVVASIAVFILATVPDHFLREHLWRHVVRQHVPRLFLWTLGALAVIAVLDRHLDAAEFIRHNPWAVLVGAALVGLIPESGPHLVFVTLFADGKIPFSILVASSIVQDGHGMLPLLAHSVPDFLKVKAVNLAVGLAVGAALLAAGL